MALTLSTFKIPKMDCPSEEKVIRMALDKSNKVRNLAFSLGERSLTVTHEGTPSEVLELLEPLKFGARIADSRELSRAEEVLADLNKDDLSKNVSEAKILKQLLAINGFMFFVELSLGLYARSTGLIADSLDMFADAAVYGLSLYAVGRDPRLKIRSAKLTGYLQLLLAGGTLFEVVRRILHGSEPMGGVMMVLSAVALAANIFCLALLTKHRTGGVHMRATYICSSTDVIANAGVILAGLLVVVTGSALPDLLIGGIISVIVATGGLRILRVAR